MRSKLGFLGFALVLYGASALIHWAFWRWLRPSISEWSRKQRAWLLATIGVLFALPMGRDLNILFPSLSGFSSWIAGVGMIWHVTMWMGMGVVTVSRAVGLVVIGARAARAALGRRGAELALAGASGSELEVQAASPAAELADRDGARPDRRIMLRRLGGAAAFAIPGAALVNGALRGRYEWVIEEVPIRMARLPRVLDGFTIAQVSDLHVGMFVGDRELSMGLGLIDRIRPDLVVITGDIVDVAARYIPLAARYLGALRARHGVACIPGNHDYYTGVRAVLDGMSRAGIDVLRNRGKIVAPGDGGGFALLGVDDLWARTRGGIGPDLALAQSMVPPSLATVLLAHQPTFATTAAKFDIDLQLSGHTHGGQINPGFRPIDLFFQYVAGRYDIGSTQLYVNRGFGTAGPPTRIGAPPEITKIVLVAG